MIRHKYFKMQLIVASIVASIVSAGAIASTPEFTSIQTETFNTAGSLSNAWG